MTARVVYSARAARQLAAIYSYIANEAGPERARSFTAALKQHCDGFVHAPYRGTRRDDLRPGIRITGFRKRVAIAFTVDADRVIILGVFYGGQDYETALTE